MSPRLETDETRPVRDKGIGISVADHDRVFGLSNRVETSVDGRGIGMATVKHHRGPRRHGRRQLGGWPRDRRSVRATDDPARP
jgi:light-regulated signal transduction histidine kinase (bacteriophytochrome)